MYGLLADDYTTIDTASRGERPADTPPYFVADFLYVRSGMGQLTARVRGISAQAVIDALPAAVDEPLTVRLYEQASGFLWRFGVAVAMTPTDQTVLIEHDLDRLDQLETAVKRAGLVHPPQETAAQYILPTNP